jgi:hypothetical protein
MSTYNVLTQAMPNSLVDGEDTPYRLPKQAIFLLQEHYPKNLAALCRFPSGRQIGQHVIEHKQEGQKTTGECLLELSTHAIV